MNKFIVGPGQNMLDLAIQLTGSVDGLFTILELNGKDLGWIPEVGEVVLVPSPADASALAFINNNQITVATGIVGSGGEFNEDFNPDFNT